MEEMSFKEVIDYIYYLMTVEELLICEAESSIERLEIEGMISEDVKQKAFEYLHRHYT